MSDPSDALEMDAGNSEKEIIDIFPININIVYMQS